MARKLIYVVAGLIAALVVAILLLPVLVDVNRFRPEIESAANNALNRKVEIGNIRLAIFSGGVAVDNISIADDPAFETTPFLQAKSLAVSVELMPLIFSRELHVTGVTIDQPQVTLLRSAAGTWNFSSLGASVSNATPATAPSSTSASSSSSPPSSSSSGDAANISVQKLTLNNGTLFVGKAGDTKRNEYDQLNLTASDLSYTTQFPFEFTAKTPGGGNLKLSGKAGPLNQTDSAKTPLDASITVQNFDLAATGFVDPASGISGVADFTGTLTSDGKQMISKGQISATKLKLLPGGAPAGVPVQVDYNVTHVLETQTGTLSQGDVHIGKALAKLTGTYNLSGSVASVQMKLVGQGMPASDLEAVLPAIGITLPTGASLKQGSLNVDLTTTGPANHLVTTGPVNLSNAELAGFDLGSKLGALGPLAGLPKGSDTIIQTLSANVRVAPEGIQANNLNLVVPTIGTLTGNGTISSDQKLAFQMSARVTASSGALGGLGKLTSQAGGQNGIPFKIQGTTSNPVFIPDVSGIAGNLAKNALSTAPKNAQGLSQALSGLLGKKK